MAARRTLRQTRITVLICTILLVPVGCETGDPSRTPSAARSSDAAASFTAATPDGGAHRPVRKKRVPVACPSERTRSLTMHDVATVSRRVEVGEPLEVVVSRTGKATLAWTAAPGGFAYLAPHIVRIADDPPAPDDPHGPPEPPDPQDPLDAQVNAVIGAEWPGGSLLIDGADRQTLLWRQDLLTPPGPDQVFTESYDVVLTDRIPGGGWSTSPVARTGSVWNTQLAVNASGAAVVAWHEYTRRDSHVYASYRDTAGSGWTSPERVPNTQALGQVGIDDAGRVLLLYQRSGHNGETLKAIRRSRAGRWSKPQRVGGPDTAPPIRMALGAGGAAELVYRHFEGDGPPDGAQYISRMSPAGTWAAPVRHSGGFPVGLRALDMDAKGRSLIAWWDGKNLMGRWSRPDGRWRKPCVLAADVSNPHRSELATQLVVNRRGDALVVWRAMGRVAQLWARYKPARHDWTEPVIVTPADSPSRAYFGVAIGDRGHAAVAWTSRNNHQLQVRRLTPTP